MQKVFGVVRLPLFGSLAFHQNGQSNWMAMKRNWERLCHHFQVWAWQTPAAEAASVRREAKELLREIKFLLKKSNDPRRGAVSQVYPIIPELLQRVFIVYCHVNIPDEIIFKIIVEIQVDHWNKRALRVLSDKADLDRMKNRLRKNEHRLKIGTILQRDKEIRDLELHVHSQYGL